MITVMRTLDGREREYSRAEGWVKSRSYLPCFQCGVCCRKWQPLVDEEEIALIVANLSIPLKTFLREYLQAYPLKANTYLLRKLGDACIFLKSEDKRTACAIQFFKPAACLQWQASLYRKECREGIRELAADGKLIFPWEIYLSGEDRDCFARAISITGDTNGGG